MDADGLTVTDTVSSDRFSAEARFHFHPDVLLQANSAAGGVAVLPGGREVRWRVTEGEARLERSTWHPRFGESLANQCLVIQLKKGDRFIFDQSKNKSVPFSCGCLRLEWGQLSESEQFDG